MYPDAPHYVTVVIDGQTCRAAKGLTVGDLLDRDELVQFDHKMLAVHLLPDTEDGEPVSVALRYRLRSGDQLERVYQDLESRWRVDDPQLVVHVWSDRHEYLDHCHQLLMDYGYHARELDRLADFHVATVDQATILLLLPTQWDGSATEWVEKTCRCVPDWAKFGIIVAPMGESAPLVDAELSPLALVRMCPADLSTRELLRWIHRFAHDLVEGRLPPVEPVPELEEVFRTGVVRVSPALVPVP